MKTKNYTNWLRNITAACLAMVIFTTSSMIALAGTENKSLMGEITVSGNKTNSFVLLNGESAFTGRTFFSNGTIATPENVTSTVKLGKAGYITMSPNTTLSLSFDEKTISGTVSAGNIEVFNADGVEVNIKNADNSNVSVVPMNNARQDDDDGVFGGNSAVGPVIVFGAIVAAAIILVAVNNDDNNVVSPIR
ncbi:MAG: hypothetical protein LH472_10845 [Pyrinomonadaceae bacterium]|nr:hypothetical protein [Pyrinomonadaceae bacterium]